MGRVAARDARRRTAEERLDVGRLRLERHPRAMRRRLPPLEREARLRGVVVQVAPQQPHRLEQPAREQRRGALVQQLQRVRAAEVCLERLERRPRGEARVALLLETGGLVEARVAGLLQLACSGVGSGFGSGSDQGSGQG